MISSIVVKTGTTDLSFTKLEIDIMSGKIIMRVATYGFNGELREQIENKHRLYLPCKIATDQDFDFVPTIATLYVPIFWDGEAIENYTQALLDELYLFKHQIPGYKTLKQIEQSFMLEMILL